MRFSLSLIYEETSYFNVFDQMTLNDVGEELTGVLMSIQNEAN